MGTPDFAGHILTHLINQKVEVRAVVTTPDKPAGRGLQMHESAVKKVALEAGLPILQPEKLKSEEFIQQLESYKADLFVVIAFRMLPEVIWSMPPKGCINLHASLLPNYRGAAPINHVIINGEKESGVTTFFIEKEIDTGAIIEQASVPISEDETAGELHDRLMELGAILTFSSIQKIAKGDLHPIPQEQLSVNNLKEAPKIFRDDCQVNPNKSSQETHNFIRGLSPFPGAWLSVVDQAKNQKKTIKLIRSRLCDKKVSGTVDTLIQKDQKLLLACSDYYLELLEVQPEGKRKMHAKEFLAGHAPENFKILD